MLSATENQYCGTCRKTQSHVVVLVRRSPGFEGQQNGAIKRFFAAMIKGWAVGAFLSAMDDFERHIICETCGAKRIEE